MNEDQELLDMTVPAGQYQDIPVSQVPIQHLRHLKEQGDKTHWQDYPLYFNQAVSEAIADYDNSVYMHFVGILDEDLLEQARDKAQLRSQANGMSEGENLLAVLTEAGLHTGHFRDIGDYGYLQQMLGS